MRRRCNILYCFSLMLALSAVSQAKGWRGLVPLHSYRENVEKLLGPPHPPPSDGSRQYVMHEGRSIYFLDEGEIYIVYASGKVPAWIDCSGGVPEGTILLIEITPKKEMRLSDLRLDEKRLKIFDPSEPKGIGYKGYLDEEAGIVVRTYKDRVEEISYVAAAKDRHLCPAYYENPKAFVQILIGFLHPSKPESAAAPNNGMHPTANQHSSYRELGRVEVGCAAGDAGR